jgi:hypothetical protein
VQRSENSPSAPLAPFYSPFNTSFSLRFAHEVEPGAVGKDRTFPMGVGDEEDGRPKDALKCSGQAPELGTALLHAEGVQHLCDAVEGNPSCLLTASERCEKARDERSRTQRQDESRIQ